MSNIIPPLLSSSPPPIIESIDDDEDDEFGDFTTAVDYTYDCDNFSLPPSPQATPPRKLSIDSPPCKDKLDFNYNSKNIIDDLEQECLNSQDSQDLSHIISADIINEFQNKETTHCVSDSDIANPCDSKGTYELPNSCNSQRNDLQKDITEINIGVDSNNTEYSHSGIGYSKIYGEMKINITTEDNAEECFKRDTIQDRNKEIGIGDSKTSKLLLFNTNVDEPSKIATYESINEISTEPSSKQCEAVKLKGHSNKPISVTNVNNEWESSKDEFGDFTFTVPSISENYTDKLNINLEYSLDINDKKEIDLNNVADLSENMFIDIHAYDKKCVENFSAACSNNLVVKPIIDEVKNDRPVSIISTEHSKILDQHTSERDPGDNFDDDDFGEFTCSAVNDPKCDTCLDSSKCSCNKQHEDGKFTSSAVNKSKCDICSDFSKCSCNEQFEDDFSDFADFSSHEKDSVMLTVDNKDIFGKSERILKEIFPAAAGDLEDFLYVDFAADDYLFNEIKDVIETNALTYNWSKSAGQKVLLKALNIDMRNILYGPAWNSSMPKFAANLGVTPLEPIRNDILAPSQKSEPSPSNASQSILTNSDVPSAQFDWSGSGLINPLDSDNNEAISDFQPTVESTSTINTTATSAMKTYSVNSDLLSLMLEKEFYSSMHLDAPEVVPDVPNSKSDIDFENLTSIGIVDTSLKESEKIDPKTDIDFGDFTTYEPVSENSQSDWNNMVPLRETYISNEMPTPSFDTTNNFEVGWLQPTIMTPELLRKNNNGNLDDDFDDFQMVLPLDTLKEAEQKDNSIIENLIQNEESISPVKSNDVVPGLSVFTGGDINNLPIANQVEFATQDVSIVNEDEEFTEFYSSKPDLIQTSFLEPLKPAVVHQALSVPSTQINWPSPGITDEDIKRFEISYTPTVDNIATNLQSEPVTAKNSGPKPIENSQPIKSTVSVKENYEKTRLHPVGTASIKASPKRSLQTSKKNSIEDDEWSEFVSVPHTTKSSASTERTSTPDLPLSVLNLSNVHPAKQPIPVITPQGLIQTKLSSNISIGIPPTQSNQMYKPQVPTSPFQPSIISDQYATQAIHGYFNGYNNTQFSPQHGPKLEPKATSINNIKATVNASNSLQKLYDEDEWSDFVSSKPLPSNTSENVSLDSQKFSQLTNYATSASPNIITNPVHFEAFQRSRQSDMWNHKLSSNKSFTNYNMQSKKSAVSNVMSLPELDFIGPKRTSSKK